MQTDGKTPATQTPPQGGTSAGNGKPFEENLARLETLVRQLERGELSLESALESYKEGVSLVSECRQSLARTAKEVEILTADLDKPGQGLL